MLRKVRDIEDARLLLDAAGRSGEGRAAWARRNGVDPRSLNAWRLNLERGAMGSTAVHLVELVPREARPAARYRVHCGALTVEVDERFDAETLRRLLNAVLTC